MSKKCFPLPKVYGLLEPRRLSENKTLERAVRPWVRRNLKVPEAKFKIDQKLDSFDVRTRSLRTNPVYFYLYCKVCSVISKRWAD